MIDRKKVEHACVESRELGYLPLVPFNERRNLQSSRRSKTEALVFGVVAFIPSRTQHLQYILAENQPRVAADARIVKRGWVSAPHHGQHVGLVAYAQSDQRGMHSKY